MRSHTHNGCGLAPKYSATPLGLAMSRPELVAIRKNYSFLLKKLSPEDISGSLRAEGLLTDHEYEEVCAERLASKSNDIILQALMRRPPGFLAKLITVLEEEKEANQHIIDRLNAAVA